MAWIKRNLLLVVGGVIALGLLGVAGFFLYTKISLNQAVTAQLEENTEELKKLVNRDPHPGTDKTNNIAAAKAELKKLQAFLNQVRHYFPPTYTNHPASREFRALLDRSIADLRHQAERAGVQLPEDYWFTFSAQKAAMTFPTNLLGPLTAHLLDVKSLCQILFDAKIVSLEKIRRVSAGQEDGGGSAFIGAFSQDYLDAKGLTNQWAVVMPYEVTFQGFSSDLADVLEGLIRSPSCFVVKNLAVEHADAAATTDQTTTALPGYGPFSGESRNPYARYGSPMMNRFGGMPPELMRRYGLGRPAEPNPAPKPGSRGRSSLLEETALRVTLTINSVKLKSSPGK